MKKLARALTAAVAVTAVSLGASPVAADQPTAEPCAKQEQKVTKAEEALAKVTAVFERQKTKVEKAEEALAAATTPEEQAVAQAKLDKALEKKAQAKKAKKAQKQRLAKAEERLEECLASQPAPEAA